MPAPGNVTIPTVSEILPDNVTAESTELSCGHLWRFPWTLRRWQTDRVAQSEPQEQQRFGATNGRTFWREWRKRDRNFVASFFSLIAVTLLSAALADEEWFSLSGGPCVLKHLGVTLFYKTATLQVHYSKSASESDQGVPVRHVTFDTGSHRYEDCINSKIVNLFIGIMGVCFITVMTNCGALILDVIGTRDGISRWLRQHAVLSIVSVFLCMLTIGLSYWLSLVIEDQQMHGPNPENVHIRFEDGFYLVVCSGLLSICAVAANLLRSSLLLKRRNEDHVGLLENMEVDSTRTSIYDQFYPGAVLPPPPPPYAP